MMTVLTELETIGQARAGYGAWIRDWIGARSRRSIRRRTHPCVGRPGQRCIWAVVYHRFPRIRDVPGRGRRGDGPRCFTRVLEQHGLHDVTVERADEPPVQSPGGKYRAVIPLASAST